MTKLYLKVFMCWTKGDIHVSWLLCSYCGRHKSFTHTWISLSTSSNNCTYFRNLFRFATWIFNSSEFDWRKFCSLVWTCDDCRDIYFLTNHTVRTRIASLQLFVHNFILSSSTSVSVRWHNGDTYYIGAPVSGLDPRWPTPNHVKCIDDIAHECLCSTW